MPHSIFEHGWSIRKLQATVLNDIWLEVMFFTGIAAAATCIDQLTHPHINIRIDNALISVLGTVLGLVISFRTSTAYERYGEGRKLWTTIHINTRALAQNFWNHISNNRDESGKPVTAGGPADEEAQKRIVKAQIEKKTMINLVHAYAVAVKHMLRGEPGVYYEDLYPLVCFLPRYAAAVGTAVDQEDLMPMWRVSELTAAPQADGTIPPLAREPSTSSLPQLRSGSPQSQGGATEKGTLFGTVKRKTFDPEAVLPVVESDRPLRPAQNPPKTHLYDFIPFLRIFTLISRMFKSSASKQYAARKRSLLGHKKYVEHVESNVPLEITMFLSSYQSWLLAKGHLAPAISSAIYSAINNLQDAALNLQRIRNTPLPFAYQAHLRMSLYLYLLYFPFAQVKLLGWWNIAGTAFTAFLFLGFLEIGQEIENPFEYDENDLDLDGFCLAIQRELAEITTHNMAMPDEYLFTAWNQPFAPADRRTAAEIVRDVAHDYHVPQDGNHAMQRTLLRSWFEIDDTTRKHHAAQPVPRG